MVGCDRVDYKFVINDFEGPLDLLLHLIRKSDMNILDIPISDITKQYLDFIYAMERINLSVASEYLVMASMLIEMKARELLNEKEEINEEEEPILTKEELTKQLLDYSYFKETSLKLKELETSRRELYTKVPMCLKEFSDFKAIQNNGDLTITHLTNAFSKFLERKEFDKPLATKALLNELSLEDSVSIIRAILEVKKQVSFEDLFTNCHKSYIIITFLSILEMAKDQEIRIKQDMHFDNIIIELRGD